MIELKDKEIEFYTRILDDFSSKVGNLETMRPDSMDFSLFIGQNYKVRYGVTKIVLIPKNRGARYVLKLPILRPCSYASYDEDWCQVEVEAYEEVREAGYSIFFAEIDYFINYNNYQTYIQERVKSFAEYEDYEDGGSYEYLHEIGVSEESLSDAGLSNICGLLLEDLLIAMDNKTEEIEAFIDFLSKHQINDLHTGNFGYSNKKKMPKIFDYSGYGKQARLYRGI